MKQDIGVLFPKLEKDLTPDAVSTGILPSQEVRELVEGRQIHAKFEITPDQIQPASLDLRLGKMAFRVRASFLPGESSVGVKIKHLKMHEIDLTRPAVLEKGCIYIVEVMEELDLPKQISGKANPKSTTGRLDIFTRLITDSGTEFERVQPGYRGKLYVEVVPRTFSILVQQGARLNQLRLIRGSPPPSDKALNKLDRAEALVYSNDDSRLSAVIKNGLRISVDLRGAGPDSIIGYKAKNHAPLIDLNKIAYYDPIEFWDPIARLGTRGLILSPDDFYILVSKERIRIPNKFSASMVPYDPSVGEFRIHYAGFFDPGFGYGRDDINGARAVLEVRSHEVPFLVEDGQIVGRLIYEKLARVPDKIYGMDIGSSYQAQGLSLSKQFKPAGGEIMI